MNLIFLLSLLLLLPFSHVVNAAAFFSPDVSASITRQSNPNRVTVSYSIFDPIRKKNVAGSWGSVSGTTSTDPESSGGLVVWRSRYDSGLSIAHSYSLQIRYYDIESGQWLSLSYDSGSQGQGQTQKSYSYKVIDGILCIIENSVNSTVHINTFKMYAIVYDHRNMRWAIFTKSGDINYGGPTAIDRVNIQKGTISWGTTGLCGFRNGGWMFGQPGSPYAYTMISQNTGKKPISVTIVDLSIGGTSWSLGFGQGQGSALSRNHTKAYSAAGKFDLTQTVSNGTSTDSFVRHISVTEFAGPYGLWLLDQPQLTSAIWGPLQDADGDGLTNLQEAVFGTNPAVCSLTIDSDPEFFRLPRLEKVEGSFRITFKVAAAFLNPANGTAVSVTGQSSSDLTNWIQSTPSLDATSNRLYINMPGSSLNHFGRIKITDPN